MDIASAVPNDFPFDGNLLLNALDGGDRTLIAPHLEPIVLERGAKLFSAGTRITHVTFPMGRAVAALIVATGDGRSAEAATIGREGVVGGIVGAGGLPASTDGTVQIGGQALRLEIAQFQDARRRSNRLNDLFARYADCLLAQVLRSTACNALHPIEERALRWLLTLQDRLDDDVLPVTQEFMAAMIGVQRTYLTRILSTLQNQGLIEVARGRLRIVDRRAALNAACECHACVKHHYDTVMNTAYDGQGRLIAVDAGDKPRRPRAIKADAKG